MSSFRKKAKYEKSSTESEERLPSEGPEETADMEQHRSEEPSTSSFDPPKETHDRNPTAIRSEMLAVKTTSEKAVESSHPPRLPYYLRNFRTVLEAVLENEDDRALFNQDDMSLIHTFEKLSGTLKYPPGIAIYNLYKASLLICMFSFQSHGAEAVCETFPEETEMAPSKQTGL